jgi:type III secretion protein HrpB1
LDPFHSTDASVMARALTECIKANRLDEAETLMQRLHELHPATRHVLAFPVMILIQRGRRHEAWHLVNSLPENDSPELKALCLRLLGDPAWASYATAHEDSSDPFVRKAMRQLLGRRVDEDVSEPA